MRVIVNISSDIAAVATGWRASAIHIEDRSEVSLAEVLKEIILIDGFSMFDLIAEGEKLKGGWVLYVNGNPITGESVISGMIKDNSQIHINNNKKKRNVNISFE